MQFLLATKMANLYPSGRPSSPPKNERPAATKGMNNFYDGLISTYHANVNYVIGKCHWSKEASSKWHKIFIYDRLFIFETSRKQIGIFIFEIFFIIF